MTSRDLRRTRAARYGGLDGCRAGWVLASLTAEPGAIDGAPGPGLRVEIRLLASFAEAVALVRDATLVSLAVDMPIGLPGAGPRPADQAARRRLGPRRSSVFPTPVRATLGARDYPEALARSRAVDGRGLSKQAFNLLPKIAEVDAAMTPELQDRIVECHPEVGFARLAGRPLATTKHHPAGLARAGRPAGRHDRRGPTGGPSPSVAATAPREPGPTTCSTPSWWRSRRGDWLEARPSTSATVPGTSGAC